MASGDVKERAMKQYLVAGLAAALITGGLVGSAPPGQRRLPVWRMDGRPPTHIDD
jgi:hypothetical protein